MMMIARGVLHSCTYPPPCYQATVATRRSVSESARARARVGTGDGAASDRTRRRGEGGCYTTGAMGSDGRCSWLFETRVGIGPATLSTCRECCPRSNTGRHARCHRVDGGAVRPDRSVSHLRAYDPEPLVGTYTPASGSAWQ